MIEMKAQRQAEDATGVDAASFLVAPWLEDGTDDGPPLPFWEQVYRRRMRRTYEAVRIAWARFDEQCLQRPIITDRDLEACQEVRRTLHAALERLRVASSLPPAGNSSERLGTSAYGGSPVCR